MATSLRPHVKLVCPVCAAPLPTVCRDATDNQVTWVLTAQAQQHLEDHQ